MVILKLKESEQRPSDYSFLQSDHLLFGLKGYIKVLEGVMRGWEWDIHRGRK